ncbi:MAG TPA: rhomboid family intramembrane serine protease [Blastocatellia bacterium]|nr:rhomboid family intramembrane serine protease [Blastocatellia bacterium]
MNSENPDPIDPRSFRKCEQCGQPTPSQQPACVNCGAVSVQALVEEQQAKEERRFLHALFSRATPVTYAILIINLAVYLLMTVVSGGNFMETLISMNDMRTVVAFGAKTNELLQQGEWFRLVTPIFIHGGLIHLASNSYAIWNIGPLVEKLYGSSRYLLIYLLSGIGGVAGSYLGSLTKPGSTPSVGASGAIFGLFGLLFVFGYRYRDELPENFRRRMSSGILPVIAINLFIGFTIPVIDNSAHIGGLITGAILTFVIPYLAPGRARNSPAGLVILSACLMVITYSFIRAYQTGRTAFASGSRLGGSTSVGYFLDSFVNGENAMVDVISATINNSGGATDRESTARLDQAVAALERSVPPDVPTGKMRERLVNLLRRLKPVVERNPSPDRTNALKPLFDELQALRQEFTNWMDQNGEAYGYTLTSPSK